MTVKNQILCMLVMFAIIPVVAVTSLRLPSDVRTIENLHISRMSAIARISASAYSEIVGLRKEETSLLASSWSVRDFIRTKDLYGTNSTENREAMAVMEDYFHLYVDSLGTFDEVALLNENGVVLAGYNKEIIGRDLSGFDYFTRAVEKKDEGCLPISKVHDSLTHPNDPERRCIAISKAFWNKSGELSAVLVAYVNINFMAEFSRSISFGKTGLSFVIDADNYILYHSEQRFYNSYTSAPQLSGLLDRFKRGEIPSHGLVMDNMDGVRRIYYYEVMKNIDMTLLLRQDYDEFASDRNSAVVFAVTSCAIILVLAIVFGLRFAGKVVRPIMKLKRAFASGEEEGVYVVCDLPMKNELGDMAQSYNAMIRKLERQFELIKVEKEKNEYNAGHDKVTGLLNRFAFEGELAGKLSSGSSYGLLYVDIDNFKQINDVYGRAAGDSLLFDFGQRIKDCGLSFELFARSGGDEFVLLKEGDKRAMLDAYEQLARLLAQPFLVGEMRLSVTISAGIAMYPVHGQSADSLITNAEIAMNQVKRGGKHSFKMYSGDMRHSISRQNNVMQTLRGCIEFGEIFLMYQPILALSSGEIVGLEALSRINNEQMGLISPIEFIPVAESDRDVMNELGLWVLREAVHFTGRLIRDAGYSGFVSVNISFLQLSQDDFVDKVLEVLTAAQVPPWHLQLEITESMLREDLESNIEKLKTLRQSGVMIALDDFGARDSSLYYLNNLPLDLLKVDHSFFREIASDERIGFMNKTVIDLAHELQLKVAAEGVETQGRFDLLKSLGYDYIQGFFLYRPLMEDSALELITNREKENNP